MKSKIFFIFLFCLSSCVSNEIKQIDLVVADSEQVIPSCIKEDKGFVIRFFKRQKVGNGYFTVSYRDNIFSKTYPQISDTINIKALYKNLLESGCKPILNRFHDEEDILKEYNDIFWESLRAMKPKIIIQDSVQVRIIPCYSIYKDSITTYYTYTNVGYTSHSYSFFTKFANEEDNVATMYPILLYSLPASIERSDFEFLRQ